MKKIKMADRKILVELIKPAEQQTDGGIIIPIIDDKASGRMGKIIDFWWEGAAFITKGMEIVYIKPYTGNEVIIDNKNYLVIDYDDILFTI